MPRKPAEKPSPVERAEIPGQINDPAFDHPRMTFAQIEQKYFLGILSPKERREAKEILDLEREK